MDPEFFNCEDSYESVFREKMSTVQRKASDLKTSIRSISKQRSFELKPLMEENKILKSKADDLLREMTLVEERIEADLKPELSNCSDELHSLSNSLKEANLFLMTVKQLVEINTMFNKAREKIKNEKFDECAEFLKKFRESVDSNTDQLKQIGVFKVLSQEVVLLYEQLMHQISEIWSTNVEINTTNDTVEILTLTVNIDHKDELTKILKSCAILNSNLIEKKFSNLLLNNVLKKVVAKKSKVDVKIEDKAVLKIEVSKSDKKQNYLQVFNNVRAVVEFLNSHLNIEVENGVHFISKLSNYIAKDFAEFLIENCLSETIPTSLEDFDKYNDVVANAEDFEKTLQKSGFLPQNSSSLLDYAKNINVLFANKFCQSYLQKAREIMKKDLHNAVKSEEIVSEVDMLPMTYRNVLKSKLNFKEDVLSFPSCQISKQAEEIMALIHSMMKEIQKSLDLCAVRLFYTVRNIFEMYASIVPLHHKKFLETLPHQVALFHNNCMYFTHHLINLTTEYYKKIPSVLKDHLVILLEEAVVLRTFAVETFEITVKNQQNQLVIILRDSSFARLTEIPTLDPNSEKSIRQCVRQLQILQKVWMEVLPPSVYNKAIGFLLDIIVQEIISIIISVEDISSQTAYDLEVCFNVLLEKAPTLFLEPKEIHRHVKKWQKFKELILILKGTLRDIDDRWADGMGPLAIEFTAEQVKHLIRALFQNSKRRADLLARIR